MATVPHVTSGLGLRKFQANGFLLTRVYRDLARGWTTQYTSVRIPEEENAFIASRHHPDRLGEALREIPSGSGGWRNRGIHRSWIRGFKPKLPHTYSKRGAYEYLSIVAISPKRKVQNCKLKRCFREFHKKYIGVFKKAADGRLPWMVQFITYMDIPVPWANFAIWDSALACTYLE